MTGVTKIIRTHAREMGPPGTDPRWRDLSEGNVTEFLAAFDVGDVWVWIRNSPTAVRLHPPAPLASASYELIERWQPSLLIDRLAFREHQVFMALAHGMTNGAIAREIHLSPKSVTTYFDRIREKTGLRNVTQIAVYAHRVGLTTWPLPDYESGLERAWRMRRAKQRTTQGEARA